MLRRSVSAIVSLALVSAMALMGVSPAAAAPAGWAGFEPLQGSSRNFTTTMTQQPEGFPAADVATNSVGGSAVGVQSGASTFLPPQTPPGEKYGSSRSQPYLNLRPNGFLASPPSTTTYSFERPTPSSGWTFVLGDIDSDQVTVSATTADGEPVDPAQLGFQETFNYCAPGVTPKPSCSGPNNDGSSLPSWDPATGVLLGEPDASDTAGSSAWFEPTVALATLTFEFAQRSGSPIYQTWFSALSFDISGVVEAPAGQQEGIALQLFDPEGNLVGETETADDGSYSFPGRATYDGYRVEVVRPPGMTSDGPLARQVDLSAEDQPNVDFSLREIVPVAVSGTVDDDGGGPVAEVTVTLNGPDGSPIATTTTDADGAYLFDQVPAGEGYTLTITPPDGFTASEDLTVDVPADSESPITDQDFTVTPAPSGGVSGSVTTEDDEPVDNVEVTITGPEGFERILRTEDDGSYQLDQLPPGDYEVSFVAPEGTSAVGDTSRAFTITADGETISDQDFVVAEDEVPPTYTASGDVQDPEGNPVPDATLVLTTPEGDEIPIIPDEDGGYSIPEQAPGEGYVITVIPPEGFEVEGDASITFDIVDGDVEDLDFVLTPQEEPVFDAGGTVVDDAGDPVPDATITLTHPTEPEQTVTTDDDGTFSLEDLPAGTDYVATITPPEGFEVDGDPAITFEVTDEDISDLDFALTTETAPDPTPTPTPTEPTPTETPSSPADPTPSEDAPSSPSEPTDPPSEDGPSATESAKPAPPAGDDLANTGGPSLVAGIGGLLILIVGAALVLRARHTNH